MESRTGYLAVGIFVAGLTLLLSFGVMWLSSGATVSHDYHPYRVYFGESVSGLRVGSLVRFRGVEVGRVSDIRIAPNDPDLVRVDLLVDKGTPIRANTVAYLKNQGVAGAIYVELTGGSKSAPPPLSAKAGEPPVLASQPSLLLRMDTALSEAASGLSMTLGRVNALLDEQNRGAFKSTLADLALVARSLAESRTLMNETLRSARDMSRSGAEAASRLPKLAEELTRGARVVENTGHELTHAGVAVRELAAAGSQELNRVSRDTVPEMNLLLSDMRDLARTMRRLAEEVRDNPAAFVGGNPTAPGPGEGEAK